MQRLPPIYCVNFNDKERLLRMQERFHHERRLGRCIFTPPVLSSDPRLAGVKEDEKRTAAVMLQHLDSLRNYLETSDHPFCVVCEDDVHIHKDCSRLLNTVVNDATHAQYDVVLLGYLHPGPVFTSTFRPSTDITYWRYPADLWGSQMYMVSRKHAAYLVDYCSDPTDPACQPYSPDWIITKRGRCVLTVPMLAVEEGSTKTDHTGQADFHRRCHEANMSADYI